MHRQISKLRLFCFFALFITSFSGQLYVHADEPWKADELMPAADLVKRLSASPKPVVLQVGVVHLYKIGHVPGSTFAGMCSTSEGLAMLKKTAQDLARAGEVVIYCGCCPMGDCPNIRPAYQALHEMGFTHVKVLNLPTNFTQDWQMKNYPVEKGGA